MTRRRNTLVCILLVFALLAAFASTGFGQRVLCGAAGLTLQLVHQSIDTVAGCKAARLYATGRARLRTDPAQALAAFDAAITARPLWAEAHAGRGEAAEELGDFETALTAYQRAVALGGSPEHQLHVGVVAGRLGRTDVALRALDGARPTASQRQQAAVRGGLAAAFECTVNAKARGGSALLMCPKPAWTGGVQAWRAASEVGPQHAFIFLLEEGRRAEALTLARAHGWTAPGVDHCAPTRETIVTRETSALLAILVHPEHAECALGVGAALVDNGLPRLARFVLADRAEHAGSEAARRLAAYYLKYRLPAHNVVKLAESLNVAGYRLQHRFRHPDDAARAYERAIAADPRFSWPCNNLAGLALAANEPAQALAWADKAIAANADHWLAWRTRGEALYALQRYGESAATYERALAMSPNDARTLADLGHALIKAGREDEGLRTLQAAVRLDPRLASERRIVEARLGRDAREAPMASASVGMVRRFGLDPGRALDRAQAAYQAGRYADALREARTAAEAEPRSLAAVLMQAQMAAFMGEFEEARAAHAKAAQLAPNDPRRLDLAATFSAQIGDYDEAVRDLDRLVALQPSFTRLLYDRAPASMQTVVRQTNPPLDHVVQVKIDVLLEQGDLEGARRLARAHGVVKPGARYCGEARSHMGSANRDETFRAFRLAVLGEPDAADCIWWYGQWLTDEGYLRLGRLMVVEGGRAARSQSNKDSAGRFLRVRVGREVPKSAEQLFQIARQRYLRDGDVEGAARLFDEAARLAPGFSRPYLYRARMAEDDGDLAGAQAWLERATAADPDAWRAHRNLGMFFARHERWAEADAALRRALGLFDDDPGARLTLARVLYAEGDYPGFARYARGAVSFASSFGGARDVAETTAFLTRFDRWGPGAALPPAPDPHVLLGWNHD